MPASAPGVASLTPKAGGRTSPNGQRDTPFECGQRTGTGLPAAICRPGMCAFRNRPTRVDHDVARIMLTSAGKPRIATLSYAYFFSPFKYSRGSVFYARASTLPAWRPGATAFLHKNFTEVIKETDHMQRSDALAFGALLKRLRKEAGTTQCDLAAALGYSESLICSLEKAHRLPDLQAVAERFIPALGLQDDRAAARRFHRASRAGPRSACTGHCHTLAHTPPWRGGRKSTRRSTSAESIYLARVQAFYANGAIFVPWHAIADAA